MKTPTWQRQGAATLTPEFPVMAVKSLFSEQFVIVDQKTKKPISYLDYFIETYTGEIFSGKTDEQGICPRVYSGGKEEHLTIWLGEEARRKMREA